MASTILDGDDDDLIDSDDYYAWLGLGRNATKDEINNAFRSLSRVYHPDKHASSPHLKEKSEKLFTKIKRAHEVLADPNKKAIYDTTGVKGLETDGWQIVQRTKTPQEILEEYEKLQREREEQLLREETNPKGNITIGINCRDVFERYDDEYDSFFPVIEIEKMSVAQSVEFRLTTSDTVVLNGSLQTKNGTGDGTIGGTYRRVISNKSWAETDIQLGSHPSITVRFFRSLWRRGFGTVSGTMQHIKNGAFAPGLSTVVAYQLDKNVMCRMVWNAGLESSLVTSVIWDDNTTRAALSLQLGLPNTFVAVNVARKLPTDDADKVKASIKAGTFGAVLEYGCEKRVTKFSTLCATLALGVPIGVLLRIKLRRGQQEYNFPFYLADSIVPEAVFYGTFAPIAAYFVVKVLIVNPFVRAQKERELQKKREVNAARILEKKRDAEIAVELIRELVERCIEVETRKEGLLIKKALYGRAPYSDDSREAGSMTSSSQQNVVDVTRPLQALVKDSKLSIAEKTNLSELPGFYDPCSGESKCLMVEYEFRHQAHTCMIKDGEHVLLPNRDHLCNLPTSG